MNILEELRQSDKKTKELTNYVSQLIIQHKPSSQEFADVLGSANDSERGTCVEALEYATQQDSKIAKPYLSIVINCLADKAPKVKWEAARIIGNVCSRFPEETFAAVPGLLLNTKDKGTVVRWSAAFALGEIAKHNQEQRNSLVLKINEIIKQEQNNGVKNVYLKALKIINK